jgi:sensor histidine kinase YesM
LPTEFSDNISVEQISFDKGGVLISFQEKEVISLNRNESEFNRVSFVQKKPIFCTFFGCHYGKLLSQNEEDKVEELIVLSK